MLRAGYRLRVLLPPLGLRGLPHRHRPPGHRPPRSHGTRGRRYIPRDYQLHLGILPRLGDDVVNLAETLALKGSAVPLDHLVTWNRPIVRSDSSFRIFLQQLGFYSLGISKYRTNEKMQGRAFFDSTMMDNCLRYWVQSKMNDRTEYWRGGWWKERVKFNSFLPGLSWPSMSAVLPFFTFSMTAPIEPSSNSLPPTTFNPSMLLLLPDPDCFRNTMWPMIFWPSLLTCQGCYEARRTGFRWFLSLSVWSLTLGRVSRENDRGMKGDACVSLTLPNLGTNAICPQSGGNLAR